MPDHPAARATHSIMNAAQIAQSFLVSPAAAAVFPHVNDVAHERIVALLTDAAADVAALNELVDAQQADLGGLRDQGLDDARELSRLRVKNERLKTRLARAAEILEALYVSTAVDLDRVTSRHGKVCQLRNLLDLRGLDEAPAPACHSPFTTPRHAAEA